MTEPSLRTSRLALAGGLAAALAVGGGGFLVGRGTSERVVAADVRRPVTPPLPATEPTPAPDDPASRVLGRAELIALAAAAADTTAAGRPLPPEVAVAEGARFELRLPFGCTGPAAEGSDAGMRWRYNADDGALRLHVAPVTWSARDWWPTDPVPAIDSIEGFWIARPWTASEACPASAPAGATGTEAVTLPGQTLAVAQFFVADDTRQGRRDAKPYETVQRIAADAVRGEGGFALRITGRIASVPGGGPVLCRQPAGSEQRPICIVAITPDEIAIENPATGATIATWNVDRKDAP